MSISNVDSARGWAILASAIAAILMFETTSPASANSSSVADFYRGKRFTITVPNSPGGGYDLYARMLARYIGQHIPGNPSVVVQNIPAAGGLVLTNQLYATAPKDGTFMGMIRGTAIQEQIYGNPQVMYDSRKFVWIANMNRDHDACVASVSSGVKHVSDLYHREFVVGASGVGAESYSLPRAYREILGMKMKVVTGYPGTPERVIAMERGEIDGACGLTISGYRTQAEKYEGKLILIAQGGLQKDPRYPDVPNMLDQAKTQKQRELLDVLMAPIELGRLLAVPPGVPTERVAALREATMKTLRDPGFVEEANKLQVDMMSMDHEEVASAIEHMFKAPTAAVNSIKVTLGH